MDRDFSGLQEVLEDYKFQYAHVVPARNYCDLIIKANSGREFRFDLLELYGVPDINSDDIRHNPLPLREKLDDILN